MFPVLRRTRLRTRLLHDTDREDGVGTRAGRVEARLVRLAHLDAEVRDVEDLPDLADRDQREVLDVII